MHLQQLFVLINVIIYVYRYQLTLNTVFVIVKYTLFKTHLLSRSNWHTSFSPIFPHLSLIYLFLLLFNPNFIFFIFSSPFMIFNDLFFQFLYEISLLVKVKHNVVLCVFLNLFGHSEGLIEFKFELPFKFFFVSWGRIKWCCLVM